ncbi:MAG: hypothetical protein HOM51_10215 [Rhodospirillaceae bacterium]|nr:hypothetical protein [Rhodospirillaceae bacterium]
MPKQTHLMRRNGRYYFRRVVPEELRDAIGMREIKCSLRTSDHRQAEELARVKAVEVDALFAEARVKSQPETVLDLSKLEIRQMTLMWFQQEERKAEADFSNNPDRIYNGLEAPHEVRQELNIEESTLTDEHDPNQQATVQQVAKRLLEDRNASLPFSDPNFQLLCELVRRGMIEGVRRSRQRFANDFSKSFFDDLFDGISSDTKIATTPKQKRISFGQLVDLYTDDLSRAHLTGKSKDAGKAKFKALSELIGAGTQLQEITRDDCRDVRAVLIQLPTNATKKFPGQPLRHVAANGARDGHAVMSTTTVNSYLNTLSALFKYGINEDHLSKNPAEGLQLHNKGSRKNDRLPFSTDQLKAIFNAPLYTGSKDDQWHYAEPGPNVVRRGRFWVPLIALFSGMRLNEICQLRINDITVEDNTDVILVRLDSEDDDKSLKSDAATQRYDLRSGRWNLWVPGRGGGIPSR